MSSYNICGGNTIMNKREEKGLKRLEKNNTNNSQKEEIEVDSGENIVR